MNYCIFFLSAAQHLVDAIIMLHMWQNCVVMAVSPKACKR